MLERSLGVYGRFLDSARRAARGQGYRGARWPKCTGPEGREWPHEIHALLIWQQPHMGLRFPDAGHVMRFSTILIPWDMSCICEWPSQISCMFVFVLRFASPDVRPHTSNRNVAVGRPASSPQAKVPTAG